MTRMPPHTPTSRGIWRKACYCRPPSAAAGLCGGTRTSAIPYAMTPPPVHHRNRAHPDCSGKIPGNDVAWVMNAEVNSREANQHDQCGGNSPQHSPKPPLTHACGRDCGQDSENANGEQRMSARKAITGGQRRSEERGGTCAMECRF